jgi:SHAQKYF class myb-like DNA-binding protein
MSFDAVHATHLPYSSFQAGEMNADRGAYFGGIGDFSDPEVDVSDDSDFGGSRKKKNKKPKKPPAPKKPPIDVGSDPTDANANPNPNPIEDDTSITGRKKRKDAGQAGRASRSWTHEEENKFWEALSIHGRDWKACATFMGTRDSRAVASHAQKAFIKACLKGEDLPDAVAATGEGYTLSGRPLDPNSSSARAYGLRPEAFQEVATSGKLIVGVHVTTLELHDGPPTVTFNTNGGKNNNNNNKPAAKKAKKETARSTSSSPDTVEEAMLLSGIGPSVTQEQTEYAKARPRRQVGQKNRLGETTESCELTLPSDFMGPAGTGAPLAQPFKVTISRRALLVADAHSHLSGFEIIGLLGGTFDPKSCHLTILEAFPCRRALGTDSSTSVELDAESQVEASEAMDERGLIPVGWYHSHPIFAPRPSMKDNENQRNYQALCRDVSTGLEPWVGLIVSPYDQDLPSCTSAHQLWVVKMVGKELTAFNVRASVVDGDSVPGEEGTTTQQIGLALEQLKEDAGRMDLGEVWRVHTRLGGEVEGDDGPLTKAKKLRDALGAHLPMAARPEECRKYLNEVMKLVEKEWAVSLPASVFYQEEEKGAVVVEGEGEGKMGDGDDAKEKVEGKAGEHSKEDNNSLEEEEEEGGKVAVEDSPSKAREEAPKEQQEQQVDPNQQMNS